MTERRFLGRKDITADVRRIQAMFGTLYAGGGVVVLDSTGISILVGAAYADLRAYRFANAAGTTVSRVGSRQDGTDSEIVVESHAFAGLNSATYVRADSPAGQISQVGIEAIHGVANSAGVLFNISAANASTIEWQIDGGWLADVDATEWSFGLRGSATAGDDVRLQADWELTYLLSTREAKTNIIDYVADRAHFMQLKPSTYNAIEEPNGQPIVGLIAENVEAAFPHLATYRGERKKSGEIPDPSKVKLCSWNDRQMLTTAISIIQQQERDIEALQARVAALEAK